MSTPPSAEDHEERGLGGPVHKDPHVGLGGDVLGGSHQDLVDGETVDLHPEDPGSVLPGLLRGGGELHAAGLSSPSGVHLSLHHNTAAQRPGDGLGLIGGFPPTSPGGTGLPADRRSSLAWYSWLSMTLPVRELGSGQAREASGLRNIGLPEHAPV